MTPQPSRRARFLILSPPFSFPIHRIVIVALIGPESILPKSLSFNLVFPVPGSFIT
jgi:hypothetical protein